MGKLILIIGLMFCFLTVKSQIADDVMNTNYIYIAKFKYKISAKTVQKRFKWNGTHKSIKGKYYIIISLSDQYKRFKILGIKFYCLPKKIRKEL